MTRPVLGCLVVVSALAVTACSSPTSSCDEPVDIAGDWHYTATQESPVPGSLNGSLMISSVNCGDFQGALDVVEVTATGPSRRITGQVSGSLLDAVTMRFEVMSGGVSREHLARLKGDSMSGSWVETGAASTGSGRFGGWRE